MRLRPLILLTLIILLAGCTKHRGRDSLNLSRRGTLAPPCRTLKPYKVQGKVYKPQKHYELNQTGVASYYGTDDGFHGKLTASGEPFNRNALTCAHPFLPLPCIVRVTNLENGRSVKLKVNDRGPFVNHRILDVSWHSAKLLGFDKKGLARVNVRTLIPETLALQKSKGLSSPGVTGKIYIDVGPYSRFDYAQRHARVIHKHSGARVKRLGKSYIISVGPFKSHSQAKTKIASLKKKVPFQLKLNGV